MKAAFQAQATKEFLQVFCKENNVNVSYHDIKEPIATKYGNLHLPAPTLNSSDEWHGKCHREASYLLKDNRFLFNAQAPYQEDPLSKVVASLVADSIAERRDFGDYVGRSRYISSNRLRLSDNLCSSLPAGRQKGPMEMLRSLVQYDISSRKQWMKDHGPFKNATDLNDCAFLKDIVDTVGGEEFPMVSTTEDFQDLVERLVGLINNPPDSGDSKDSSDSGDSKDSSDSGDSKDSSDSGDSGDSKDSNDGENQEGDAGDGEGRENADEKGSNEDENETGEEEPSQGERQESEDGEGNGESKEVKPGDAGDPGALDEVSPIGTGDKQIRPEILKAMEQSFKDTSEAETHNVVEESLEQQHDDEVYTPVDHVSNIDQKMLDRHAHRGPGFRELLEESAKYPLSRSLKKYLLTLTTSAYSYGLKKGKIHQGRLNRVLLNERQPKVFKLKQSSKVEMDTAISILTDCSGSMYGAKMKTANIMNMCIMDVLKSIHANYELLGFSEDYNTLNHMIFKGFNENITRDILAGRLLSSARVSGCNSDGDSIIWACERLLQQPQKRKIMIVLSDGQPAGNFTGDGREYLKKVCAEVEERTPIDLWGIGILTDSPKRYYKNNVTCNKLENLGVILMQVLKSSLVK